MTAAAIAEPVTADHLEHFQREGWLVLRDVIEPELIAGARAAMAHVTEAMLQELLSEGLIASTRPDLPFERRFAVAAGVHAGRFGRSWRRRLAGPGLFALQRSPRLVAAARRLLGGPVHGHPVFNARPKLPDQQLTVVPWHQDSAYFGAESVAQTILTAWVPLVPTSAANGGMQVLPRSHRSGLATHVTESREGAFLEIPDVGEPPEAATLTLAPGDVLLFGNLLWHRSLPNASDHVRWSIDLRYYPTSQAGTGATGDYPEPWRVDPEHGETTPFERWHAWTQAIPW